MKARDLGARRISSFARKPIQLNRLIGRPQIPLVARTGRVDIDAPFRVLVKCAPEIRSSAFIADMTTSVKGAATTTAADRLGGRLNMRPLGPQPTTGPRWYAMEFPVSLGGLLDEVDYDLSEIQEFVDDLMGHGTVLAAEPDLPQENLVRPLQENIPGCTAGRDAAPADVGWAPRLVRLFDLPADGPTGAGIRIGQIDTGYTFHGEVDVPLAYDVLSGTSTIDGLGGFDPMPGGTSHGTATATVITSRHGTTATNDLGVVTEGVSGLAVGARIVPVRALDSVVIVDIPLFFPSVIATAVNHCIAENVDVITMSIGGVVSQAVRDAIHTAYENDIIMCAAAGNCVGFVVEPASLPEVIGCGGVGIDAATGAVRPWPGTSEGPGVDISAPAENVWIGDWIDGSEVIRPGEGTSFAAPHVAGAAALWLEHHGREALIARYEGTGSRLCDVFRDVIRNSAQVPPGWNTQQNGAGVVDVVALINEPLPAAALPAEQLDFLDLIPVLAEPVDVVVDIDHLTVRDDGEFFGGAEPYMLMTFFKIDGTTASIEATLNVADLDGGDPLVVQMHPAEGRDSFVDVVRRGEHGNVSPVNIGPLELNEDGPKIRNISSDLGVFRTELKPIPITLTLDAGDLSAGVDIVGLPGFIGVHAMLFEEDFTPGDAIDAAHEVVADGIRSILENVLAEIDLSDLSVDPADFVEEQAQIEDDAAEAAAAEMDAWELFWGGVVDPDDQLLNHIAIVNVLQLEDPHAIEERYTGDHGDWLLVGEVRKD